MADASRDLTIVVTTSPIPSMPSTALLQTLLASLDNVQALADCRVLIVCDGVGKVRDGPPNWKCSQIKAEHVVLCSALL